MTEGKVYLALYKGKKTGWTPKAILARLSDWLTRKLTKGLYSHCEIVVNKGFKVCYSSSIRDGGVRSKIMYLEHEKWDLIELQNITEERIKAYFEQTKNMRYDWWGALGIVLGIKQKRSKYFCSEWCFNAICGGENGWRFSPNQLGAIFNKEKS
ncbi:enoyl-CoA hydratase [Haemophilus influenzae]|uniref:enoyl-CoA hydratase n=1 Tax=Haemophilus influenzae TaxID=727 RepID=UPI000A0BDC6F|nr:enoyl-CoA hydratase [Haemophilus influenzae]ORJ41918.1 enoyl-CoA hydratase [Haemophilus influenzae]